MIYSGLRIFETEHATTLVGRHVSFRLGPLSRWRWWRRLSLLFLPGHTPWTIRGGEVREPSAYRVGDRLFAHPEFVRELARQTRLAPSPLLGSPHLGLF